MTKQKLVPFVHVTSKVQGAKYPNLSRKIGPGWPQAAILDAQGQLLARLDCRALPVDGVEAIQTALEEDVAEFYALRDKAKKGKKEAKAEFFMKRLELDHVSLDEMKRALGKTSVLDDYQKAEVHERVVTAMTAANLAGLQRGKASTYGPFAKKLLAQHKSVGLPEGPEGYGAWSVILDDAYLRKDAKTFALAFRALRATGIVGKKFIEKNQKRLAEIGGGK